ncbi:MAG TPA: hypothetical protein VJH22_03165 [Candidatus Nanoarchaeia archaeon]|nr:hypothetical protein [Candidatus Nanoarchaeia archaeon]
MSSLGDDVNAELQMMIDSYARLQAKDPRHELLKLSTLHADRQGVDFSARFFERCYRPGETMRIVGYARYTRALQDAHAGKPVKLVDTDPACDF